MNDRGASPNAFESGKPGTAARSRAEAAIEALRARGGLFVDAVAATRMAMALTDPALPGNPIVFANQSFLDLSGYSMEEVLGQQPFFMNGPDTDPEDAERFRRILDEDRDGVVETVQYAKDGHRFVATLLLSAFKGEDGETLYHFMSWADVTRRVDAEEDAASLRKAQATLRDGEERRAFLLELSDALRPLSDAAEIQATTARLAGMYLGVDRAMYAAVTGERGAEVGTMRGQFVRPAAPGRPSPAPFPEHFTFGSYGAGVMARRYSGEGLIVADVETDPAFTATERAAWAEAGVRAAIVASLVKDGRLVAEFGVHSVAPRSWTQAEVSLVWEVAERTWAAAERARAEAAARESERRQRFLLALGDAMRAEPNEDAVVDRALVMLSEELGLDRCYALAMYPAEDRLDDIHEVRRPGLEPMPSPLGFSDFPEAGKRSLDRTLVYDDIANDPELTDRDKRTLAAMSFGALLAPPLRMGAGNPIWALGAVSSKPRRWTPGEVALVEEAAERTWVAKERVRAETALAASEEKHRSLFETMGQGYCELELVRDDEGRAVDHLFLELNPAFERLSGIPAAEARGRLASDVFPAIDPAWTRIFERIAETGRPERVEHPLAPDRWFEVYAYPGPGDQLTVLYEDISDRKRAEAALRGREERQAFLLKLSDALRVEADPRAIAATSLGLLADFMRLDRTYVARIDKDHDLAEVGPEYRRADLAPVEGLIRLSDFPEAFARMEATTLVLRDTATDPALSQLDRRSFAELRMGALIIASAREGMHNPVWALLVATEQPRAWTAGEVALVEEVAERTWAAVERARAEEALRGSEQRYRELFEGIDEGFCIVEMIFDGDEPVDYRFVEVNPAFERHTGIPDAEGRLMRDIAPDHEQYWFDRFGEIALTGITQRFEAPAKALGDRWFDLHAFRVGDPEQRRVAIVFSDVTQRKRDAEALRESEERFRQFAENSVDVLWIYSAELGKLEYLSPAYEAIWGEPRGAVTADPGHWGDRVHPDDHSLVAEFLPRLLAGEVHTVEYRIVRPDGGIRTIFDTGFPVPEPDGTLRRVAGIVQDITTRRVIEEALMKSEQFRRVLLEGIPQLVWRAGGPGEWTWASPQWCAHTGQTDAQSHGWGWLDAVHPDDAAKAREAWARAPERSLLEAEYRIADRDGSYRWFQTRATPVRDGEGAIVEWLGTSTDIDDIRKLQHHQATLLAELQHRVRNTLAVLRSIARRTAENSDTVEEMSAHLQGRIAAFSRVQSAVTREPGKGVSLALLVADEMIAHSVDEGGRLSIKGPTICLDTRPAESVSLAIHELATNAVKYGALSSPQGRISVRWEEQERDGVRWLRFRWTERGLEAPLAPPVRRGFGMELFERSLAYDLGAEVEVRFPPEGLEFEMAVPKARVEARA